jgi:hypothetical protein
MTDDNGGYWNARSETSPDDALWAMPILAILFAILFGACLIFMWLATS